MLTKSSNEDAHVVKSSAATLMLPLVLVFPLFQPPAKGDSCASFGEKQQQLLPPLLLHVLCCTHIILKSCLSTFVIIGKEVETSLLSFTLFLYIFFLSSFRHLIPLFFRRNSFSFFFTFSSYEYFFLNIHLFFWAPYTLNYNYNKPTNYKKSMLIITIIIVNKLPSRSLYYTCYIISTRLKSFPFLLLLLLASLS